MPTIPPKVSIVIPVYNTEQYLDECLRSVTGQSLRDLDIICIDDGSTDASGAILDDWASRDKRIRVIHQDNAGVSHARNVGLSVAIGEYLCFVDSDDYVSLVMCESLFELAQKEQADIVVFGGQTFPTVGWIDWCMDTSDEVCRNDSFEALFKKQGSNPLMCNKMYRRSLLEANGIRFNEGLKLGEDNAFQFCVFPHASVIAYCSDMFYFYRCEREGSALDLYHSDHYKKITLHFELVEYIVDQWKQKGFLAREGQGLLEWMVDFFYDDLQYMDYNFRFEFSNKLRVFCAEQGLLSYQANLSGEIREIADIVLSLPDQAQVDPVVTMVLKSALEQKHLISGFRSLANQFEQRIQIFCLADGNEITKSSLVELVNNDTRAQLIEFDTKNTWVDKVISEARGQYILFASLEDKYDAESIKKMVETATKYDADIVSIHDSNSSLRARHMDRFLEMPSQRGARDKENSHSVTPHELENCLFNMASLSSKNKLYKRSFVADLVVEGEHDPYAPLFNAIALMRAHTICPSEYRGFKIRYCYGCDALRAKKSADDLRVNYASLKNHLDEVGQYSTLHRTFANAYLSDCFSHLDTLDTFEARISFCEVFKTILKEDIQIELYPKGFFWVADDYETSWLLLNLSVEDFVQKSMFNTLDNVGDERAALLKLVKQLQKDSKEFHQSISYRAGRIVTYLPRKAATLIKRIRH